MARIHKQRTEEDSYLIGSFPASVCENIRIPQARIYGAEEGPNEEFCGYIASKDEYFFGVKVHLLVTAEGHPVEAFLTPGGRNDRIGFERQLPNTIHAVTAEGFKLEVFLFVLAVSFGALV